ncbi:MAG: hypothetical protein IT446_13790 [Phycisphaerales bacterium]|jgi:hypothetical protein|nr:hypothetical protein [Phycisphaerales bacterium]
MIQILQYYGRYRGFRDRFGGLPSWARVVLFIFAVPGIVMLLLSLLAFAVSLLALLILTVPVYRLLAGLSGSARDESPDDFVPQQPVTVVQDAPRRHVDVKIIE